MILVEGIVMCLVLSASGHIPGAVNAPLSTISDTTLPKDKPLFLKETPHNRVVQQRREY